jgi:hypothetical protein
VIVAAAVGIFIWLGVNARVPRLSMDFVWVAVLTAVMVIMVVVCGWGLWKRTRFC